MYTHLHLADKSKYQEAYDYRGFFESDIMKQEWRGLLRSNLFNDRKQRSCLTFRVLGDTFDMHEGIFLRNDVPKGIRWSHLIFSGVNCFLLKRQEHENAPNRTFCYWIAAARYGKDLVDWWIDSLPFKSTVSKPWVGTNGLEEIMKVPLQWNVVQDEFYRYYSNQIVLQNIDRIA